MLFTQKIASLGLAFASCIGAVPKEAPLPPSRDPWYTAPTGFEHTRPGAILRVRQVPGNLTASYPNCSATYNVLYRTTDSNYQPAFAVTTLFVPISPTSSAQNASNAESTPTSRLVSYQIPYNSPFVDSSPSFTLSAPYYVSSIVGSDIASLLAMGYYVSVPDHEGPLAAFGCAVSEGHATLDSIRAVLSLRRTWSLPSLQSTSADEDTRVVMWGYSGGSLASEFAAELQTQYAPELHIAGAALGGLVTNFTSTLLLANKSPFAGLVPAVLLGLSKQHSALNRTLRASLNPQGRYNASTFLSAGTMGVVDIFALFSGQDLGAYFLPQSGTTSSLESLLRLEDYVMVANRDVITGYHGVPQMPVFMYKAIGDELCPIQETDALVQRYCGVGVDIQYQRNSIGEHVEEETEAEGSALAWIKGVMEERHVGTGCELRSVALNSTGATGTTP